MYEVFTHPVLGMEFVKIPRANPQARQLWAARELLTEKTVSNINKKFGTRIISKSCVAYVPGEITDPIKLSMSSTDVLLFRAEKVAIPTLDELEWILSCSATLPGQGDWMNGFGVYPSRGCCHQWTTTINYDKWEECWPNHSYAVCGVNKSGSIEVDYRCYIDEAYVRLVIYDV